jgi:hypothetical protein
MIISLIKFKDYLGRSSKTGGSPVSIKAQDLDDNFAAVMLKNSSRGIYKCEWQKDGTELVFRAGDAPVSWYSLTVCANGVPKNIRVLGTPPQ